MRNKGPGVRGQGSGLLQRWAGPAVILLAAAIAVTPQLVKGNSCGHDFDFHLVSWFDANASWHNLQFYPHWTPSANYGAGEPRFVFYPPLTWMLGAALSLAMPWTLVPIALTFLLLAGTGLATRALAREVLTRDVFGAGAPTLAGCAAMFSGYALFTAYERTAFGELAGGLSGPAAIALVIAGAWLSNAPVGVMASYMLAAVAAVLAVRQRSWAPLLRALVGVALGLGLAAIYLVPAAWEQKWVDIAEATNDPGLKIENLRAWILPLELLFCN